MTTPINIYKEDIDFAALALQDVDFAAILKPNGQLDFSDPEAVQQLTKSLLKRDFDLSITLPPDRLCPPVPNRLNYLLWIQSLLSNTGGGFADEYEDEREVLGIDVGTGASCVYPLLGCALHLRWRFVGTDIDEKSLQYAKQNVEDNNFQQRIKLLQTKVNGPLLPLDELGLQSIDFTMCNPPFYSSQAEMLTLAAAKLRPPFTACTGSANEMVTPGGEVVFVSRMIDESLLLQERVQWYTSMLGKFSSLPALVERLRERGVRNYAVTEFAQGTRTRRWGVAWSFGGWRPGVGAARGVGSLRKELLPFPAEFVIVVKMSPLVAGPKVNEMLTQLPMKWTWRRGTMTGLGFSKGAVWSRASRRQASRQDSVEKDSSGNGDGERSFGFEVEVAAEGSSGAKLIIRWIKGHDSVMFESFCGMLKRKVEG